MSLILFLPVGELVDVVHGPLPGAHQPNLYTQRYLHFIEDFLVELIIVLTSSAAQLASTMLLLGLHPSLTLSRGEYFAKIDTIIIPVLLFFFFAIYSPPSRRAPSPSP